MPIWNPESVKNNISGFVGFKRTDAVAELGMDFRLGLKYARILRSGLIFLMIRGVLSDARGTQRHQAVFYIAKLVRSLQKLVIF